jgi:hypothetical protein
MKNRIFSMDNPKAAKAQSYGYLNAIHYLAPYKQSGKNLCPHASPGCVAACLGWTSGQAGMVAKQSDLNSVRQSRIDKARRFMAERAAYMRDVVKSIQLAQRKAERLQLALCVRMNGSSDIAFERMRVTIDGVTFPSLMDAFPTVQFVDYTKSIERALANARGDGPRNYRLTFSRSEANESDCVRVLCAGGNVAAVFETKPDAWHGFPVIDGDSHDLRHLDPRGAVVALSIKGNVAKRDSSGFVIRNAA